MQKPYPLINLVKNTKKHKPCLKLLSLISFIPVAPLYCGHSFLIWPSLPQIKQRFSLMSLSSRRFHFSADCLGVFSLPVSTTTLASFLFWGVHRYNFPSLIELSFSVVLVWLSFSSLLLFSLLSVYLWFLISS